MSDKKKKTNYQELSYSELVSRRDELKKKYMEFRFKMVLSHVDNPMEKRAMRKEIARLNTFIHQRDLAQKFGAVAGNK
ncbi:MAG: 50S ribosomal protein L29 [Treponemataceae bacterium]|nr:50S ribosomal protein L29 [Treponemataceae bacterium]